MFHFAPPEVNGLGSSTSTSSVTRSSQVLMFFGLPLRTMNTTTDSVTNPSYSFWFQLLSTSPASTSLVISGSRENSTTSAGRPPPTRRGGGVVPPGSPPQPTASAAGRTAIARVSVIRRVRMRSIFHLVNRLCRPVTVPQSRLTKSGLDGGSPRPGIGRSPQSYASVTNLASCWTVGKPSDPIPEP